MPPLSYRIDNAEGLKLRTWSIWTFKEAAKVHKALRQLGLPGLRDDNIFTFGAHPVYSVKDPDGWHYTHDFDLMAGSTNETQNAQRTKADELIKEWVRPRQMTRAARREEYAKKGISRMVKRLEGFGGPVEIPVESGNSPTYEMFGELVEPPKADPYGFLLRDSIAKRALEKAGGSIDQVAPMVPLLACELPQDGEEWVYDNNG